MLQVNCGSGAITKVASVNSSFGETASVDENKSIDEVTLADSVDWE